MQNISKQSKLMYGLVLEEVATKDEASTIYRHRPHGFSDMNSAESRVGSSGFEHVAFLQMKITRSNGQSGNTGHVGARDIFQVNFPSPPSPPMGYRLVPTDSSHIPT